MTPEIYVGLPYAIQSKMIHPKGKIHFRRRLSFEEREEFINTVNRYSQSLGFDGVFSRRRFRVVAEIRQVAMFILSKVIQLTYKEIGRIFNRDHSTIVYSNRQVARALEGYNPTVLNHYNELIKVINL
jgi:chromosomal replication initiation ATPase DnaA